MCMKTRKKCRHVLIKAEQTLENRWKLCWLFNITLFFVASKFLPSWYCNFKIWKSYLEIDGNFMKISPPILTSAFTFFSTLRVYGPASWLLIGSSWIFFFFFGQTQIVLILWAFGVAISRCRCPSHTLTLAQIFSAVRFCSTDNLIVKNYS